MQPQVYKLFGFSMIGLGLVILISLFTSLYNPLLGISLALPIAICLIAWAGINLWQSIKTDVPELTSDLLSSAGETVFILLLFLLGIFLGVM